jgi:hypothetical protein
MVKSPKLILGENVCQSKENQGVSACYSNLPKDYSMPNQPNLISFEILNSLSL